MSRYVSEGMQDAPDVDAVFIGYVENEVGELLERPAPKFWNFEFVGESEGPGERVLAEVLDCVLQRSDELDCSLCAGLVAVVGHRGFDVECRESADVGAH